MVGRYEGPPTRKALEHYDRMLGLAAKLEQLGPELADEAVRLSSETELGLERAIEFVQRHGLTSHMVHTRGQMDMLDAYWLSNHGE